MRKIIATYGGALIAILIMSVLSICVISLIFGKRGEHNAIGILAEESMGASSDFYVTGDAFLEYKERRNPEIIYNEDTEVLSKEYVPVRNCFTAKDQNGDPLLVEVSYILNIHEEPEEIYYIDGEACFYFELHGVYKVFVQATDQDNNTTYAMVKMPVNKGGFH